MSSLEEMTSQGRLCQTGLLSQEEGVREGGIIKAMQKYFGEVVKEALFTLNSNEVEQRSWTTLLLGGVLSNSATDSYHPW